MHRLYANIFGLNVLELIVRIKCYTLVILNIAGTIDVIKLNARAVGHSRPIATQFPCHGYDHRSLTSTLNVVLIRQIRGSFVCLT